MDKRNDRSANRRAEYFHSALTTERQAWAVHHILVTLSAALPKGADARAVPAPCFLAHLIDLTGDLANRVSDSVEIWFDSSAGATARAQPAASVTHLAATELYKLACLVRDAVATLYAALPVDAAGSVVPVSGLVSHVNELAIALVSGLSAAERNAPHVAARKSAEASHD